MSEKTAIEQSGSLPVTETSLVEDFLALGLSSGMTVLVHASLSRLGWVCGGPTAVIRALERVLTHEGTLVMPAHSTDLSEPGRWKDPPVPESWWEIIRQEMPAFESDLTPTRAMGIIAETFRKQKGTVRSLHPALSFCAWGKHAGFVTEHHSLGFSLGEKSPLARLYDLDGKILLLGVGHDSNTSLHLAEYRSSFAGKTFEEFYAPVMERGKRIWKMYRDLELDCDDFPAAGSVFEQEHPHAVLSGRTGYAESKLIRQKPLVDFAVEWFRNNRGNR